VPGGQAKPAIPAKQTNQDGEGREFLAGRFRSVLLELL
jgi:hypothetical protein